MGNRIFQYSMYIFALIKKEWDAMKRRFLNSQNHQGDH